MTTLKSKLKTFALCSSGGAAIYAALTAPVMVGGAALSVDVSRLYNLDQQLQSAADAYARAGAAELDGKSDAIIRANRAIQNLAKNSETYVSGGEVSVGQIRFLTALPANSYDSVPDSLVTTNASQARFVEVLAAPSTIKTIFPPSLSKGIASVTLDAVATAGFEFGVCGTAPIFVCNPYEDTEMTLYEALEDENERRRQIRFINPGGNCDTFAPGAFGYLDPFEKRGVSGANVIKDAVAIDVPATCFQSEGVHLRPGKIQSMRDAVNVRFDIYKGRYSKSKYRNNPAYAPAANVTKGWALKRKKNGRRDRASCGSANACTAIPDNEAFGLPRDDCFYTNSCTGLHGMMGDGDWDFLSYVEVNHNKARSMTIYDTTYNFNYYSRTVTPSTPPTRYEMYRWEIEFDCIPGAQTYGNNVNTPEEGIPVCHNTGAYTGEVDRRIIHAAVLNCNELEETYNLSGGNNPPLPAEAFIEVFLTEPMGNGYYNSLYGEMVGLVEGRSPVARDVVAMSR